MNDTFLRNAADPVTTEIVRNFVISCAEDMNASLWRSAHSAVIYEGRDSAVALLDADGNMLGQSSGVPLFIGAIDANVHHVMDYYGDDIAQGDVFIMNDSYMQGSHLHDVSAVGPIFFDGELIGFGAARAHWNDIGAIDPGTVMGSTNIYQEGLRLGPTRIVAQGKPIREWFDLLRLNTRMPDASIGDLGAQIAAIRTGERRLSQLLERIGIDTYRAACENIFEQARRMDREAIAAIKDGIWYREGYLDNDGAGEDPVKVALTLTVKGEELIVDLAGSSGLVPGSVNCGASQTVSLLRLAYKTMINPERAITGGSFETMTVRIPDNCLFNAKEPAACEWYFTGLGLLADLFISCLSEAIPDRSTAAHYGEFDGGPLLLRRSPEGPVDVHRGHRRRLGRPQRRRRRECADQPGERQLPQHPGRGDGNEISRPPRGVLYPPRFRRAGAAPRRLRRRTPLQDTRGLPLRSLVRTLPYASLGAEWGQRRKRPEG